MNRIVAARSRRIRRALRAALVLSLLVSCAGGRGVHPTGDTADHGADTPTDDLADAGPDAGTGGDTSPDAPAPRVPEYGSCEPSEADLPTRPAADQEATLPALHVEGTEVVDASGQRVALRGINFGAWLMMETWIAGIGVKSEGELLLAFDAEADALGLGQLLEAAKETNLFEWVTEQRSHWSCITGWRAYMHKNATPEQREAVAALWAWFDGEPWIFEERSLWRWLQKRFGHATAESLRTTYQEHYITELDVERLAALGLNLIRLPVWYDALETDFVGDVHFQPDGWARLDRVTRWARRHGVYVMIDLHGAPGGQSTSWHQGLEDGGALWDSPACIAKTARIWSAIASYFAGDPHVAVYDMLNEPHPWRDDAWAPVHQTIYDAIRAHDPDTIVMAEDGYLPSSYFASPSELGWENAMFSVHLYPGGHSADSYEAKVAGALETVAGYYDRFQVPLFLGEFNPADDTDAAETWPAQGLDQTLALLNARGVHWAPWTWKYYADHLWGLYHPAEAPGTRIDVRDASAEEIGEAFERLHSTHFVAADAYVGVFAKHADAPAEPLTLVPEFETDGVTP